MSTQKEIIFGMHAIFALVQQHAKRIIEVYIAKQTHDKKIEGLVAALTEQSIAIKYLTHAELDQLTHHANHQGVVAVVTKSVAWSEQNLWQFLDELSVPAFLLILDGVQDPHNLGACLRSADAFGVHAVIAPKDKAVGLTATVAKVACGAAETVPFVQVTNLVRTIDKIKERGIWVYGAAGEANQTVYQCDLKGALALVLGAEGSGLRRLTREHCDGLLSIPMHGMVSSLNVSVATGVFLSEAMRQRQLT